MKYAKVKWYKSIIFKQVFILLFAFLPSVLFFLLIYYTFMTETIGTVSETTLSKDQAVFDDMNGQLEDIIYQIYNLFSDGDLQMLSDVTDVMSEEDRIGRILSVQDRISWIKKKYNYSFDIHIYLLKPEMMVYTSGYYSIADTIELLHSYTDVPFTSVRNGDESISLFITSLGEAGSNATKFVGEFIVPQYWFRHMLNAVDLNEKSNSMFLVGGEVYLRNFDNQDLETEVRQRLLELDDSPSQTFNFRLDKQKYFCSAVHNMEMNFSLITIHSYSTVFHQMMSNFQLLPILFGIIVVTLILYMVYFYKYINRPISILSAAFSTIDVEKAILITDHKYNAEFRQLYHKFNDMSLKLKKYIEENYLQKIELQRTQLKQLQSQIDPHFLYNTLYIIKIRINRNNLVVAEELTSLLSEYFRFINRNAQDVIHLADELKHTVTYARIQAERFSDKFDLHYHSCPEHAENVLVPRLILQPFVENAIKYGIDRLGKYDQGILEIGCEQGENGKVIVTIESSGIIYNDEIKKMNENVRNASTEAEITSTINIYRRIQLFYGTDYGIYFVRSQYGGVKTIVELDGRKIGD